MSNLQSDNFISYEPEAVRDIETDILSRVYEQWISRETCITRDEPVITWITSNSGGAFIDMPATGGAYEYYSEKEPFLALMKETAEHLIETWDTHDDHYARSREYLLESARALTQAVASGDRDVVLRTYQEHMRASYAFGYYIMSAWGSIYYIEPEIGKRLPNDVGLVMSLEEPIEYLKFQWALFEREPQDIIDEFGWLNMYSAYDEQYTQNDILDLVRETKKSDVEERFKEIEETKEKFASLVASIDDKRLQTMAKIVHRYAWLKTDRVDAWRIIQRENKAFYSYLQTLAPTLSLRDVTNLFSAEIIDILEGRVAPHKEDLTPRSENRALYVWHNGKADILVDDERVAEVKSELEGDSCDVVEVKGTVASKGTAVGTVKVVTHSNEVSKVEEGDIFVAKYTFPAYTPYMLKSAAIVTDDGGITSHAAIISREYKKPCIIGTKIATRVFKDGDRVEVDTETGVVRKL